MYYKENKILDSKEENQYMKRNKSQILDTLTPTGRTVPCAPQTNQRFQTKQGGIPMTTIIKTNPNGNKNTISPNGTTPTLTNSTNSKVGTTAQKGLNMTKVNKYKSTNSNAKATSPLQKGENMNQQKITTNSKQGTLQPAALANNPIFENGNTITKIYKAYCHNKVDMNDARLDINDFCSICCERVLEQQTNYNPSLGNHGQHNSGIIKHIVQEISDEAAENRECLDPNSAEHYLENSIYQDDKDEENIEGNTGLRTITSRKNVDAAIDHSEFKSITRLTGYELAEANDLLDLAKDVFGENSLEYKIFRARYFSNHHIPRPELAREFNTQIQPIRTAEENIKKKAFLFLDQKKLTSREIQCRHLCETEHYKELKKGWAERRKAKNQKRR